VRPKPRSQARLCWLRHDPPNPHSAYERMLSRICMLLALAFGFAGSTFAGPCPQGEAIPDGCEAAQFSGVALHPDFFRGYTGAVYPLRPPWNVPGVDYPVGHAGALANPASEGVLPACASYLANRVTVNGDIQPCVLDHLDFTANGGVCVTVTGRHGDTVTFTNDAFSRNISVCPYHLIIIEAKSVVNIKALYLDFNDESTESMNDDFAWVGSGSIIIEYSYFRNLACRILNTSSGSKASAVIEHNFLEGMGAAGGCHAETVEYNSSETVDLHKEDFNNYYEPASHCCGTGFAYVQSAAPGPAGPGAMNVAEVSHNVMITRRAASGKVTVAAPIWVDTTFNNSINSLTLSDNYIDSEGSYWPILVNAGGSYSGRIRNSRCSGNVMMTAAGNIPIRGLLGKGTTLVKCD